MASFRGVCSVSRMCMTKDHGRLLEGAAGGKGGGAKTGWERMLVCDAESDKTGIIIQVREGSGVGWRNRASRRGTRAEGSRVGSIGSRVYRGSDDERGYQHACTSFVSREVAMIGASAATCHERALVC